MGLFSSIPGVRWCAGMCRGVQTPAAQLIHNTWTCPRPSAGSPRGPAAPLHLAVASGVAAPVVPYGFPVASQDPVNTRRADRRTGRGVVPEGSVRALRPLPALSGAFQALWWVEIAQITAAACTRLISFVQRFSTDRVATDSQMGGPKRARTCGRNFASLPRTLEAKS